VTSDSLDSVCQSARVSCGKQRSRRRCRTDEGPGPELVNTVVHRGIAGARVERMWLRAITLSSGVTRKRNGRTAGAHDTCTLPSQDAARVTGN